MTTDLVLFDERGTEIARTEYLGARRLHTFPPADVDRPKPALVQIRKGDVPVSKLGGLKFSQECVRAGATMDVQLDYTFHPDGSRLNGYPIIHRAEHRDNGRPGYLKGLEVVMVYREDAPDPFVVATWAPSMESGWHQGDYCETLDEALECFEARRKK